MRSLPHFRSVVIWPSRSQGYQVVHSMIARYSMLAARDEPRDAPCQRAVDAKAVRRSTAPAHSWPFIRTCQMQIRWPHGETRNSCGKRVDPFYNSTRWPSKSTGWSCKIHWWQCSVHPRITCRQQVIRRQASGAIWVGWRVGLKWAVTFKYIFWKF